MGFGLMLKPLGFCCVLWFVLLFGAAQNQFQESSLRSWMRPIRCHDIGGEFKVTMYLGNLSRRENYHFACYEEGGEIWVYFELESSVLGLEGSRAWCYEPDRPSERVEIKCSEKMARKITPRAFPSHTCTIWNHTDQKWFHAVAKKDGNVTCRIWGAHMNETFSFGLFGQKVADTPVAPPPAPGATISSPGQAAPFSSEGHPNSSPNNLRKSKSKTPTALKPSKTKPQATHPDAGPSPTSDAAELDVAKPVSPRPGMVKEQPEPSKPEKKPSTKIPYTKPPATDPSPAGKQNVKEKKPATDLGGADQPEDGGESAHNAPDMLEGARQPDAGGSKGNGQGARQETEGSQGHANAAVSLSLTALSAWCFSVKNFAAPSAS